MKHNHWLLAFVTAMTWVLAGGPVGLPVNYLALAATYQAATTVPQQDPVLQAELAPLALSFQPGMTAKARSLDFHDKLRMAMRRAGIQRLSELREEAMLALLRGGKAIEWESLRTLANVDGKTMGVWLTVPVWLPRGVHTVTTHGAPVERWQDVQGRHRFAGEVYLPPSLGVLNDKKGYQPGTLTFETFRGYAPFAYLLCEAIFREGWFDVNRRVPILSIRSGEDTYAADTRIRPGRIPCFDFQHPDGKDFVRSTVEVEFQKPSEVYHGRHALSSNHRLGCALDINDINCNECKDGSPNPISRAGRHFLRDRMHALDARNLPFWVYTMAEEMGHRVPYQWNYGHGYTDWQHLDCGVLDAKQWERMEQQLVSSKP
ncbi:MAG TPA: hypothetical protein DCE18_19270 [Syntrophobacteraceae bacterium]|nr:hypothetical protein [Syntrophobacteraceae bacterium]HBZ56834.1 hypothetical protein [Syntrophobacteraceae bacterium]